MESVVFAISNQMVTDMTAYYRLLTQGVSLRKLHRGYYTEIKDIVENRARMRPQRLLDLAIFISFLLRFTLHLIMFYGDCRWLELWRVDYLVAFGYYYPADYNGVICFIVLNIVLFGTIAQWMLYFSPVEMLAWKLYYDIVVNSTDAYLDCFKDEIEEASCRQQREKEELEKWALNDGSCYHHHLPRKLVHSYVHYCSLFKSWINMDHIEGELLAKRRLTYLPSLSPFSRAWLHVGLDLLEMTYLFLPVTFRLGTAAYFIRYSFKFVEHFPRWYWAVIFFEVVVFNYVVIIFVRISHICSFNVLIATYLYGLYVHQLYKGLLTKIMAKYRHFSGGGGGGRLARTNSGGGGVVVQIVISADIDRLNTFLAEHTRVCYYLLQSNRDIWGRFLLAFVPIQLLTMIFLSFYLLVEEVPIESRTTFTYILYMYILVMFIVLLPLSYIAQSVHSCAPAVYTVQGLLPKYKVSAKLKYMTFYERLANEDVIYGLSVGPIRTITFTIVGQVGVFK